jgi:hypothetical protein
MSAGLLQHMLLDRPDPNEPIPLSNRKETIYGAVIPFFLIAWFAIGMRMWVRIRIMREPGWDDFLVVVAGIFNTVATGFVLSCKYHTEDAQAVAYFRIQQLTMGLAIIFFTLEPRICSSTNV